jgi:hypothetical protein
MPRDALEALATNRRSVGVRLIRVRLIRVRLIRVRLSHVVSFIQRFWGNFAAPTTPCLHTQELDRFD